MITSSLTLIEKPPLYFEITDKLDRGRDIRRSSTDIMPGFEDVIPDGLGQGWFYNTFDSILQLKVALSVAPNPQIEEEVSKDDTSLAEDLIHALRVAQVLADFKVLDLGCGMVPGFALAAKSLGAEVHTADGEQLEVIDLEAIDSHTTLDLNDADAIATIEQVAGGEFDFITSNIIGSVPGHPHWQLPETDRLQQFSERLLATGGYHFEPDYGLRQRVPSPV